MTDIKKYREQYQADIAAAADEMAAGAMESDEEALENLSGSADEKVDAILTTQLTADNLDEKIDSLIAILRKKSQPVKVREAALNHLSRAEFFGAAYEPHKVKVEEAVRQAAMDSSTKLRHSALQNLAMSNDDFARDILIKSLESDNEDVIDNAKAIRFLGFDDHGEVTKIVKSKFKDLDDKAKTEAVRVMASDPGSAELLSELMNDKSKGQNIRQISAIGLQEMDESKFIENTLKAVEDDDEDPIVKAAYIAAVKADLAGMSQAVEDDEDSDMQALSETIRKLQKSTKSRTLKGAAKKYLDKAGRS